MIWRLQAIESKGFEGTVLGTLIMPYCSGFANLVFAFMMSRTPGNGRTVIENCIVKSDGWEPQRCRAFNAAHKPVSGS